MRTISKALVRGASVLFGFAIAATGGVVGIGSAYAQSNECGCLVPAGTPGVVQSVSGSVFVSQANGSVAAQPGMQLQAGNSALVGPQSTSIVGFGGNCTLHLRANISDQAVSNDAPAMPGRPIWGGLPPTRLPAWSVFWCPPSMTRYGRVPSTARRILGWRCSRSDC